MGLCPIVTCLFLSFQTYGFSLDPLANRPEEQTLTLYSEQAFYYSYFLRAVSAPTWTSALWSFFSDDSTEFPNTVNPLHRFNIFPEAVIAGMYRFIPRAEAPTPLDFMLNTVWLLSGIQAAALYLCARVMSAPALDTPPAAAASVLPGVSSRVAALVAVFCYVAALRVTTRVFTHPTLRENYALPFLWIQMAALAVVLREDSRRVRTAIVNSTIDAKGRIVGPASLDVDAGMGNLDDGGGDGSGDGGDGDERASASSTASRVVFVSTVLFMLCWQFGPFVLLLQLAALLATRAVGAVSLPALRGLVWTYAGSIAVVAIVMAGNVMLLTSLFSCLVIGSLVVLAAPWRPASVFLRSFKVVVLPVVVMAVIKVGTAALAGARDDAHVFRILRAKLAPFEYRDFDTMQYLCGPAYNMLPDWVYDKLGVTLIGPAGLAVVGLTAAAVLVDVCRRSVTHVDGFRVFFCLQAIPFSMLGIGIMRLMMFGTVSLCLLASMAISVDWWEGDMLARLCPCVCSSCRALPLPRPARRDVVEGVPPSGPGSSSSSGPSSSSSSSSSSRAKGGGMPAWRTQMWMAVLPVLALILVSAGQQDVSDRVAAATAGPSTSSTSAKELANLMQFLHTTLKPRDVVVATPVVSSAVMASFAEQWPRRPAVSVHPHAESPDVRLRYRLLYQMYARLPEPVVASSLAVLGGTYVVVDFVPCDSKCVGGYGYDAIANQGQAAARQAVVEFQAQPGNRVVATPQQWKDAKKAARRSPPPEQFCYDATETPLKLFKPVFQSDRYLVLKVKPPKTTPKST